MRLRPALHSSVMLKIHTLCPYHAMVRQKMVRLMCTGSPDSVKNTISNYLKEPVPRVPNTAEFEPFWYKQWSEMGLFKTETSANNNRVWSMILPPPNITGNLHLGHALTVTIQDAVSRYQRMKGKTVSWIPGYDHAGIATQLVLDKIMVKEHGVSVRDLSPEQFAEITVKWRDARIQEIRQQLQELGASLDFTKEYYTLAPEMNERVKDAFIYLFDAGLIYRKSSLVNWSFFLKSTLSDIEVDWLHFNGPKKLKVPGHDKEVEFGVLHHFAYPVDDDVDKREIIVATTRMETMVGDVAVAVHPEDDRYGNLIGKRLVHPLTGKKFPIVADPLVQRDFGTGAVKITPSHSQVDYDLGQRHGLPQKPVFDEDGCIHCQDLMTEFQGLHGMNRFQAKDTVIKMLSEIGLYRGRQPHKTTVPVCSRSGDVIESVLKEQWFLDMKDLNQQLKEDLETGKIKVIPEGHVASWTSQWIRSHEWCISRQIRWGHQVPAFRVIDENGQTSSWVAARSEQEAYEKLGKTESEVRVIQDKDVLDTWFSSSLLPFSVFGVKSRQESNQFFPLSLMETGFDILGFWVHRMMIMSKAIIGRYPFDEVLLHGMVCDAGGKKMSKSKGNVIDPKEVITGTSLKELLEKSKKFHKTGLLTDKELIEAHSGQRKLFPKGIPSCGADALRLSLCQGDFKNRQITIDVKNIAHNRTLINKMWQTIRFFEINSRVFDGHEDKILTLNDLSKCTLTPMDEWILSRLSILVSAANRSFDDYNLHHLYASFHNFWFKELCSVYLESLKPLLNDSEADPAEKVKRMSIFKVCLETAFKVVHPIMPFVTEELFQRTQFLSKKTVKEKSILREEYPDIDKWAVYNLPSNSDQSPPSLKENHSQESMNRG